MHLHKADQRQISRFIVRSAFSDVKKNLKNKNPLTSPCLEVPDGKLKTHLSRVLQKWVGRTVLDPFRLSDSINPLWKGHTFLVCLFLMILNCFLRDILPL